MLGRYCAVYYWRSACRAACTAAACCSMMRGDAPAAEQCVVEHSDEYLCTGGAYRSHIVELVSKRAPSGSIIPFVLVVMLICSSFVLALLLVLLLSIFV